MLWCHLLELMIELSMFLVLICIPVLIEYPEECHTSVFTPEVSDLLDDLLQHPGWVRLFVVSIVQDPL